MKNWYENIIEYFLKISVIIIILIIVIIFRYYIEKQEPLKMERLNEIVEKEIVEIHGKN